jgi:hypothetical protein
MILLKIGYIEILLKDETGVQQLLKILGKGIEVDMQEYKDAPSMQIKGPVRVSMQVISERNWRIVPKKREAGDEPGTEIIPANLRCPPAPRANGNGGSMRSLFPR